MLYIVCSQSMLVFVKFGTNKQNFYKRQGGPRLTIVQPRAETSGDKAATCSTEQGAQSI